MGSSKKWLKLLSRKHASTITTEAASVDKKPSMWTLWKSFRLIKRKSVCAGNKKGIGDIGKSNVAQEERAAICIQTAFRGLLAKRALRALKGLVRLQAAISGHDSRKLSAASLQCVQAFVRVQAKIHRERAIQNRHALGLPQKKLAVLTVDPCTANSEMEWCNALGTVEEIRAKEQQKQVAALKRDRAIAYAFCNKWKDNVKVNPGSLFDVELDNSTWSWIWLDEWVNGKPKKEGIKGRQASRRVTHTDSMTRRLVRKKTAPAGFRNYLNAKVSPGKSTEMKDALKREGSPGRSFRAKAGKGKGIKVLALQPNAKLQPGHSLHQSKQFTSKNAKKEVPVPKSK